MVMRPDGQAVVVGAGVIGVSCALALARAGRKVVLIDQDEPGRGCSFGNAGHIATEQRTPLASPETLRNLPSMLLDRTGPLAIRPGVLPQILLKGWGWRYLKASRPAAFARGSAVLSGLVDTALADLHALLAGTSAAIRLIEHGHHLVWQSGTPADIAQEAEGIRSEGVPVREWSAEGWPLLPDRVRSTLRGGLTFTGTAHVTDPWQMLLGLQQEFHAHGGLTQRRAVRALQPSAGGWLVWHDDGALAADAVVVATGVAAGDLLEPLGYPVPMIAERGYHVALPGHQAEFDAPIVFKERGFIVTPMENEMRATTTTEFSPRAAPSDPRRPALLRRHLIESGLLNSEIETRDWMGSRPTLPDYLPVIGASRWHDGLHFAFGHQHLGLTLSATTARLVTAMITGQGMPPAELGIERFAG
jgi:D-amino-acid dehydrogenase